jgi:endonuclease/exonuclease/phosphatase family metal-dependent hydrolase
MASPLLTALLLLVPLLSLGDAQTTKPIRDPAVLRVMTYNIHIPRGMDGEFDAERIAKVIRDADVDLVAIQEVDVGVNRSGRVDQCAQLARLTGMHAIFGKGRDYDGGQYGQMILSRRPLGPMTVHPLPGDADQERRVALFVTVPQPEPLPGLRVVATHLHHADEGHRLRQAAEIERLLDEHASDDAVLLLGDLNATPGSKVMKGLLERWVDAAADAGPTFPADKPDRRIDYILLPKDHGWDVIHAEVLEEPVASDHRPVVVELRWRARRPHR